MAKENAVSTETTKMERIAMTVNLLPITELLSSGMRTEPRWPPRHRPQQPADGDLRYHRAAAAREWPHRSAGGGPPRDPSRRAYGGRPDASAPGLQPTADYTSSGPEPQQPDPQYGEHAPEARD